MFLPTPRGPLTGLLFRALRDDAPTLVPRPGHARIVADPLADEDLQLALWTCYELHYRGFDDVCDAWEWNAELLAFRAAIEAPVVAALRRDAIVPPDSRRVADRIRDLVESDTGASASRYLQTEATHEQFGEYVTHRSIYQLKEADPHTWAIPRLSGGPKAALVEIQNDEYGEGEVERMHSQLFAETLRHFGLDDRYGAHVDAVPAITLAHSNVMSLFGLHRRFRGAILGHLAVYEMCSAVPCRRLSRGLRRLGAGEEARRFYDVHITADSLHEQVALHDLCGGLADQEPELADDIVFGAAVCLYVDGRFAAHVLGNWADGRSSLRHSPAELASAG